MTFENIMHKKTAQTDAGFSAMLKKDTEAQRAAVAEYFQHWDNKEAKNETDADRAVSVTLAASRVASRLHHPPISQEITYVLTKPCSLRRPEPKTTPP